MSLEEELNNLPEDQGDLEKDLPETEAEQEEIVEDEKDVTTEAKATGHLSKEEWVAKGGDPNKYKTEKEFVLTGELIELKKALHKRDSDLEELVKYHRQTIESQKQSFRQQLEARLNIAKEEGDVNQIEALAKEKSRLEQQDQIDQVKQTQASQQQAAQWFLARNQTWFNDSHPELKQRTQEVEQELINSRIYQNYSDLARALEDRMRSEIATNPDYAPLLSTRSASRPTLTSNKSGVNATARTGSGDEALGKLSKAQQTEFRVLQRMHERSNIKYSVKDYIEQTKSDGEV